MQQIQEPLSPLEQLLFLLPRLRLGPRLRQLLELPLQRKTALQPELLLLLAWLAHSSGITRLLNVQSEQSQK